jgi:glycosyltransferase involved in cell wall biosynthesis
MKEKGIFFFTPYAGRTGSEMMLSHLMKELKNREWNVALYSEHLGELLKELDGVLPYYYNLHHSSLRKRIVKKLRQKMGMADTEAKRIMHLHHRHQPGFWYINTIMMPHIAKLALENGIPYMVHFHELDTQYAHIDYEDLKTMVGGAKKIVCCSSAVKDRVEILGAAQAELVHECIDTSAIIDISPSKDMLTELGLNANWFTCIMSGQRIDRKGFDIFLEMAEHFKDAPINFIWLGNGKNSGYDFYFEQWTQKKSLQNLKILYPKPSDYYRYMLSADCFLLTSKEDPYPLVMLEAATCGLPIISFPSGGVKEFIQKGMGKVLNDFSRQEMITVIQEMVQGKIRVDKELLRKKGLDHDYKNIVNDWIQKIPGI